MYSKIIFSFDVSSVGGEKKFEIFLQNPSGLKNRQKMKTVKIYLIKVNKKSILKLPKKCKFEKFFFLKNFS